MNSLWHENQAEKHIAVAAEGATLLRAMDVVIAITAIALLLPLMSLIAMVILIESGRPILFMQPRVGQYGRIFSIMKFRKFFVYCKANGLQLTLVGDSRLTSVGKFLLVTKFDELPQLLNVLKGEMSIVGPRPESVYFADCFAGGFEEVLRYKPGIFGPSQASFRSESKLLPSEQPAEFYRSVLFPLKALIDLRYYPHRTLLSDMMWIVASVLAIFGCVLPIVPFQVFRKSSKG